MFNNSLQGEDYLNNYQDYNYYPYGVYPFYQFYSNEQLCQATPVTPALLTGQYSQQSFDSQHFEWHQLTNYQPTMLSSIKTEPFQEDEKPNYIDDTYSLPQFSSMQIPKLELNTPLSTLPVTPQFPANDLCLDILKYLPPDSVEKQQSTAKINHCLDCNRSFTYQYQLENHLKTKVHQKMLKRRNLAGKVQRSDSISSRSSSPASSISSGLDLMSTTNCSFCARIFSKHCYLLQHIAACHPPNEKPFRCARCGKCFATEEILQIHGERHDSDNKKYKCDVCPRQFHYRVDLTRHKDLHNTKRKFECEFCKKGFTRKDFLRNHMKTHEQEQPIISFGI